MLTYDVCKSAHACCVVPILLVPLRLTTVRVIFYEMARDKECSGVPRTFFSGVFKNFIEGRVQRERGSGGGSPLVRGSAQFANE
jgi:hypothetical protein